MVSGFLPKIPQAMLQIRPSWVVHFAPEQVVHIAPDLLVHFSPEYLVHFTADYSVINADTESPGVVKEALHLISENFTYKTVFLTNGDACLLRRKPEPAASASGCYVVSFKMLQGIIKVMLDRKELPKQDQTVKTFTSVYSNRVHFERKNRGNYKQKSNQREKLRNHLLLEEVKCSQCNTHMTIFLGVNHKGIFPRQILVHNSHQGCFQCIACGRYYCWDCSNSRKPCSCGAMQWQERQYFPAGVSPEQALRGLV